LSPLLDNVYSIRELVRRIGAEDLSRNCGPEGRRMRILANFLDISLRHLHSKHVTVI